ncbi:hypothetical protein KEM48_009755 [Puccinia striiformis f. sp. tritici PST-130]|nr:hypothetical protein KEM48_009755 [Puccinia striiformis f. sp. tritici PST-130]
MRPGTTRYRYRLSFLSSPSLEPIPRCVAAYRDLCQILRILYNWQTNSHKLIPSQNNVFINQAVDTGGGSQLA